MQIHFKGEGYCHWSIPYNPPSYAADHPTSFTGKEEYFNLQLVVWSRQNAPDELLPTGTHNFPFQFTLPTDRSLPTSFEASRRHGSLVEGYIRYTIKAGIESDHPNFYYTPETRLSVLEIVSVDSPLLRSPVQLEQQKFVGFLCCTSGPVVILLDLPKTGFCVGECVPAVVHIANNSRRDIRMSASIYKIVTYQATGGGRQIDRNCIAQVTQLQPVQPRASETFNTDQLVIPLSTSPTQSSSAVIKIEYLFEVFGGAALCLGSWQQIPIVIGNVQQSAPTASAPQPGVPSLGNTAEPNPGNIGSIV